MKPSPCHRQSPTLPTDGLMPERLSVSPNLTLVYCDPTPEVSTLQYITARH